MLSEEKHDGNSNSWRHKYDIRAFVNLIRLVMLKIYAVRVESLLIKELFFVMIHWKTVFTQYIWFSLRVPWIDHRYAENIAALGNLVSSDSELKHLCVNSWHQEQNRLNEKDCCLPVKAKRVESQLNFPLDLHKSNSFIVLYVPSRKMLHSH